MVESSSLYCNTIWSQNEELKNIFNDYPLQVRKEGKLALKNAEERNISGTFAIYKEETLIIQWVPLFKEWQEREINERCFFILF